MTYTRENGLYVSYKLHPSCHELVADVAQMLDIDLADNLHLTVMYSKTAPNIEQHEIMDLLPERLEAKFTGITYWKGHNDKCYIVLTALSEELQDIHAALVVKGAHPTFTPYRPHVTVGNSDNYPLDEVAQGLILQYNLATYKHRPTLVFYRPKAEDLDL